MTRQEIEQYFAELERAGLFVKSDQFRERQPVYVASEWGVKLRREHPDLFNQIINTCDDLDVLQRIYEKHKNVLAKYRQERGSATARSGQASTRRCDGHH